MGTISRLGGLVTQIGQRGLLSGSKSPWSTDPAVEPGSTAEALPAVQTYVDAPELPDGCELPDLTRKEIALALVAGARRAAADVAAIERAAAEVARHLGATVRELAAVAEISERAANDRYRRTVIFDPQEVDSETRKVTWRPSPQGERVAKLAELTGRAEAGEAAASAFVATEAADRTDRGES